MEPIEIAITIELGALILAGIGLIAGFLHQRNERALERQAARQEQEKVQLSTRHHDQFLKTLGQKKGRAASAPVKAAPRGKTASKATRRPKRASSGSVRNKA